MLSLNQDHKGMYLKTPPHLYFILFIYFLLKFQVDFSVGFHGNHCLSGALSSRNKWRRGCYQGIDLQQVTAHGRDAFNKSPVAFLH